ncbi:MAG: TGS domain-containing protein [Nanoarchaeota archaeon]
MPINAGYEYSVAIGEFDKAKTPKDKLKALQKVLAAAPNHKSSEKLRSGIKQKIAKLREQIETQGKKKSGGKSLSIKKEGAAQICLVGTTQSGKTTFLNKVTNVNAKTTEHPFTTTKPEIGTLDYKGIKLQVIEMPAVTKDFIMQEKGGIYLGIIKQCDLIVVFGKDRSEVELVLGELRDNELKIKHIIFNKNEDMAEKIWGSLELIKVYTKQPGKEKDQPPIALKKDSTVKKLAEILHKDFINKFKFARIWGKGAKFGGMQVGLNYKLNDENVVEFHLK